MLDLFSQIENPEREEILQLRQELTEANYKYYVENTPTLSDYDFDRKLRRLQDLEAQYPDMFDSLDGFTYYQNSVSHHSRTYPSIPYLLTKQTCYFDVPYPDYIANAHQTSTFLEEIKATGADTRIYTSSSYVDDSLMGVVDNYKTYDSSSILAVKPFYLIKKMLKISLYRILPYLFKDYFQYSSNEINNQVINNDKVGIYESDDIFARYVRDYGLTVDESYEKAFRFYQNKKTLSITNQQFFINIL